MLWNCAKYQCMAIVSVTLLQLACVCELRVWKTQGLSCLGFSCEMHQQEAACSWLLKRGGWMGVSSVFRYCFGYSYFWVLHWGLTICPWKGNVLWAMCHTDLQVDLRTAPLARLSSPPPSLWIWVSLMVQRNQPSVLRDKYLGGIAIPLSLTWKLRWKAKYELL